MKTTLLPLIEASLRAVRQLSVSGFAPARTVELELVGVAAAEVSVDGEPRALQDGIVAVGERASTVVVPAR